MKILLDTHAVLWAGLSGARLSHKAAIMISDPETDAYVSAASIWEIATKVRLSKLLEAAHFEANMLQELRDAGYELLPITPEVALRAGRLAGAHGDPFDRMIAAQALALDIPVISADAQLDIFGIQRIW